MNQKERVSNALKGIESDIPIDFGGNPVTGIHCSVVEQLRAHYGLTREPVRIQCPYQMLGVIEDDLREAMGIDTIPFWSDSNMFGTSQDDVTEWETPWGQNVLISRDLEFDKRPDGSCMVFPQGDRGCDPSARMPADSFFFDALVRQEPVDEENLEWEHNTEEFTLLSDQQIRDYSRKIDALDDQKWIVGNFGGTAIGDISLVPGVQLKHPRGIRDISEWYMSSLTRPEYLHNIFSYQTEIALENLRRLYSSIGNKIDSIYICGTDFGTQNGPICSPDTYKTLYKPYHSRINAWIHENTQWKTFKHSCGSVELFIEDFIDAGFDILNPIQWTAAGMGRTSLKKNYGDRIAFWGGGVDTQKTLPFGSPQEVKEEVLETCSIFHKGGRFVFSSVHNIQAMTPVENVIAMIDAVHLYNA
jgi:hypothetical protein